MCGVSWCYKWISSWNGPIITINSSFLIKFAILIKSDWVNKGPSMPHFESSQVDFQEQCKLSLTLKMYYWCDQIFSPTFSFDRKKPVFQTTHLYNINVWFISHLGLADMYTQLMNQQNSYVCSLTKCRSFIGNMTEIVLMMAHEWDIILSTIVHK